MIENHIESSQFSSCVLLEIAAIGLSKIMIRKGKTIIDPTKDMIKNWVGLSRI